TPFYASATDAAGNTSACSAALTYVHDSFAPARPVFTGTVPSSPSNQTLMPTLQGTAEGSSLVRIYTNSSCSAVVAGMATASATGDFAAMAGANRNAPTTYYAAATDAAGNTSPCSAAITYVHDDVAPAPPSLTGTSPSSPSNGSTMPRVLGTSESGASIQLYTS